MTKLTCNKSQPPLGALIAASYINSSQPNSVKTEWSEENSVEIKSQKIFCETSCDVLRALARITNNEFIYGVSPLEKTQIDYWLCFTLSSVTSKTDFATVLENFNKALGPVTFLVGKHITIADFAVFSQLFSNKKWIALLSQKAAPAHVTRWYNFIEAQPYVQAVISSLSNEILDLLKNTIEELHCDNESTGRAKEGKFVDLPGAEMGKVIVRFPPEASGYLHIGHAKAALLNQYYQQEFNGRLIMRFDDTNPAKENVHFEEVILEDVDMLEIKPDIFSYTSDYFELMLKYCEQMLNDGKAYVDDTDPEVMKQEREQKVESANRNNGIGKNLEMWNEMLKGTSLGQKCCVRAKIDMNSLNGCLRDPTIYRCKNETHPRTGNKYKVYPTYDFACPIVDSIEGVTHTLRTMEYHDRDPQFYWFIDALGLRKPYIWEYSRLSMTNTVLSKRKLTWFVEQGLVDGWDDPRMPTVRGVLRRGMTVKGLKEFIIAQGSSRSVVFMEWDKIWAFNKKVIDPIAPRYTVVDYDTNVLVNVKGAKEKQLTVPKHPKNGEVGSKIVWVGPRILIDRADAECLKEGENATFINWGNLRIVRILREGGKILSVEAEPNLENKDYKKTMKLTFLCDTSKAKMTPTFCVYFDHIISKPLLGKDEDFKAYIGHETRKDIQVLGDPELSNLKEGNIIQIQRRGYFRVDVPYAERSLFTCKEQPVILFNIPDGSTKENPFTSLSKKDDASVKKAGQSKSDKSEKSKTETGKNQIPLTKELNSNSKEITLLQKISDVGDKIRKLKTEKADKEKIKAEVEVLLELKNEFKIITGKDWKPEMKPAVSSTADTKIDENDLTSKINLQGNVVRDLKTKKSSKDEIDSAVKTLLELKAEYKKKTGKDFPAGGRNDNGNSKQNNNTNPKKNENIVASETVGDKVNENDLTSKINSQGNLVRDLKAKKSNKDEVDSAVKTLLELKAEYKKTTGKDFPVGGRNDNVKSKQNNKSNQKKDENVVTSAIDGDKINENDLTSKINSQGNMVRDLKAKKASKDEIDSAVNILLELKGQYKKVTGKDFPIVGRNVNEKSTKSQKQINESKPQQDLKGKGSSVRSDDNVAHAIDGDKINENDLTLKINNQGSLVRDLKAKKANKEQIESAVKILLELKGEFKKNTGKDFPTGGRNTDEKSTKAQKENKENKGKQLGELKNASATNTEGGVKKQTRLGLEAKKEEDLPNWYSQVITKSELIEYYDVSGCYIYRPWSFSIWESIKDWLNAEIKKLGVQNCYFPIFVSKFMLEKEKSHIADFSPEVAWVTKSGDSEMSEPIAIRPTSETVMYPAYAKWIQSYRDLPMKLNQWNNVVRWEFKHPQPFLRTREFLWQEGHTAFATFEEANEEVLVILDLYSKVYTDLLAVPVIKGRKTEKEKFAGGLHTYTVEAYISASGRAIQGATSHHLGQNFSKMFDIVYEDPETQEKKYVYQNSWGLTTRTIGVMIMVHSDNQGLVLPPNIASIQVIIVPCGITANFPEDKRKELQQVCDKLEAELKIVGIRAEGDYRTNYSPGWKFNHWELKGVPIRVELGPKDMEKSQMIAVRRDTGEKLKIPMNEAQSRLRNVLKDIHENLYAKALADLNDHVTVFKDWPKFVPNLEKKMLNLVPFCGNGECEDNIKTDSTRDDGSGAETGAPSSGAKSLCIPLDQPAVIETTDKCIHPKCNRKPLNYVLFGRSY